MDDQPWSAWLESVAGIFGKSRFACLNTLREKPLNQGTEKS